MGCVRGAGLGLPASARARARGDGGGRPRGHRAGARRLPPRQARRRGPRARRAPPAGHRRVHADPAARARPRPRARGARSCSRRYARDGLDGAGALRRLRADRLRLAARAGRRGLAHAAVQPGPDRRRRGRAGGQGGAAPARRHDGGEPRRRPARAGGLVDRAVPGHRAPAHRRHRPGRADPPGARAHRAHPHQGRRRGQGQAGAVRQAVLHRGRARGHVPAGRARATSTSPRSSRACVGGTTTAGTCWSRTRSSPRSPAARARWPTCRRAWSTCAACCPGSTVSADHQLPTAADRRFGANAVGSGAFCTETAIMGPRAGYILAAAARRFSAARARPSRRE